MREPDVGDPIDQYRLTRLLARTRMASIFEAFDTEAGVRVALKIPHLHVEGDVVGFARFEREEGIGRRLRHPGIVRILDPRHKSRPYIAMEYVEGSTLRALLDDQTTLPTQRALAIAGKICEVLVYLHQHGVVHRDIKPENVVLSADDQPRLLDFGIALDRQARRLTWQRLSGTFGTPDYVAPEQIAGRRGDARTDVYALGTVLFEMLTGQLPYSGDSPQLLLYAKAHHAPAAPAQFARGIDPAVERIVLKAVDRLPRNRYQSAAELLEDLRDPSAAQAREPELPSRVSAGRARPERTLVRVVIAGVLAGLVSLVWLTSRSQVERLPPPSTQQQR
ncbi:MAG TPA: serine/threonine-protein kinase [Myxococcales bacterium]|nr:serine/threonine-protein kinase [Myxococcales bacterium]